MKKENYQNGELWISLKEKEKTWTKLFLCQEGAELFQMKAKDMKQAQEFAQMYNAVVIKELIK